MSYRWYQREAIDAVFAKCKEDPDANPLIVAPTGAGKSHIISGIISESIKNWGDVHFLVLAHRQELLVQNESKLPRNINTGFFCAGLGRKQVAQVTFASIGSVFKHADKFKKVKGILVDECHLLPSKEERGMYRKFLSEMHLFTGARVIGLTATPYRLDSGKVYGEGRIFSEVTYDCDIKRLTEEGFLSPIIGKEALSHVDTGRIKLRGGEFLASDSESLFMQLIGKQCEEIMHFGSERKKWLIFCSGIKHAQAVAEIMTSQGIKASSLTGLNTKTERAKILQQFARGEIQAISNCDVLTTGFDQPDIDLIALLRPTKSTGLYVQMVGRGLRVAEGKENCLLLDFGENVKRHGVITDIKTSGTGKSEAEAVTPVKVCSNTNCLDINSIQAEFCKSCKQAFMKECPHCSYAMPVSTFKLLTFCTNCKEMLVMRDLGNPDCGDYSQAGWQQVTKIDYNPHFKINSSTSMKITYYTVSGISVQKFICIEQEGGAFYHAKKWCNENIKPEFAHLLKDIKDAKHLVELAREGIFREPNEILVSQEGKWFRVARYNFESNLFRQPKQEQEYLY